ncbi:uncharacterized protein LOC131655956 [Vicia villosa]|uniref:uncharacterized protein LOC131655956 n=1 Tax=Vicia villosa TaxID=3911 RepID=UPI00273B9E04|nr:uncharacterized protein LOC131655956 [Vicia villosa]
MVIGGRNEAGDDVRGIERKKKYKLDTFINIKKIGGLNLTATEMIVQLADNAIIQQTLPQKEKDPGRVTLPVTIGNVNVGKALIDLGSSINIIPLPVIKRIGDLDIKNTRMTLQLADKSVTNPCGIAEDVLVKVDKFLFLIDFVVMDIEEDDNVPLILGRPS